MTRARRIRTVVAALTLSLLTAAPVISAQHAPAPRLGDPVVVERAPRSSAVRPSGGPYEDGGRLETSSPSAGSPQQTGQPTGTGPSEEDVVDVSEPTPTGPPTTSESRPSSEAEPVLPVSPPPASSGGTGTPTPAVTPNSTTGDGDDDSDGDDGGGGDD
ncbi:hypothetical protein ABZW18_17805 [Streptomyces sp. NPDC004647]|uniref:hypothetical protein n=1 Tax=Streptomyces sp. NPDC004647 TaxID=3154671 RepID=UPI0033AAE5C9